MFGSVFIRIVRNVSRPENLQIGDQRIDFQHVCKRGRGGFYRGIVIRVTQSLQCTHASLNIVACVGGTIGEPRIGRHDGIRHNIPRVQKVHAMPDIGILAANSVKIRAGSLGASHECLVVNEFAGA